MIGWLTRLTGRQWKRWCLFPSTKMAKHRIMLSMPHDSPGTIFPWQTSWWNSKSCNLQPVKSLHTMGWCGCDDRWQVPILDWHLCSEWTEACRPAVVADWKAQCYHGQESRGDSTKATTSNCGTGCVTKKSKAVGSSSEYTYMCMCMHIVWINWSWHKWRGCKLMWPELPDC